MPEEELEVQEPQEEEDSLGEESFDDSLRSVASSMVSSWSYERTTEQIVVFFHNGREQTYDCSPELWAEAKEAPSPGRFIHANFL